MRRHDQTQVTGRSTVNTGCSVQRWLIKRIKRRLNSRSRRHTRKVLPLDDCITSDVYNYLYVVFINIH